eukprot:403372535
MSSLLAAQLITHLHGLGFEDNLNQDQLSLQLDQDPKFKNLFEFLISNVSTQDIVQSEDLQNLDEIQNKTQKSINVLQNEIQKDQTLRCLNYHSDYDKEIQYLETDIDLIDREIQLIETKLSYNLERYRPSQINPKLCQDIANQSMDIVDNAIDQLNQDSKIVQNTTNQIINEYLILSKPSVENQQQVTAYQLQLILENHPNKILQESINSIASSLDQYLGANQQWLQLTLDKLKQESQSRADIAKLKEQVQQEDTEEIIDIEQEKLQLLQEVEEAQKQLMKAWRDNLKHQISFNRWKHTLESVEKLKKHKNGQFTLPTAQNQSREDSDREERFQILQEQVGGTLQSVIDAHEEQLNLKFDLLRQEIQAKSDLQSENMTEQLLLQNLKQIEQRMNDVQSQVNLAQALTEWDQYQTQDTLDHLQQIVASTQQISNQQEIANNNLSEVIKIQHDQQNNSRATVDERDKFLVTINKLIDIFQSGLDVHSTQSKNDLVSNKRKKDLFVYKEDILEQLQSILANYNQKSDATSSKQDKLLITALNELFINSRQLKQGELLPNYQTNDSEYNTIMALLSEYKENTDKLKYIVEDDLSKNTIERNGVVLQSHEVISDFLNNRSEKIKIILK